MRPPKIVILVIVCLLVSAEKKSGKFDEQTQRSGNNILAAVSLLRGFEQIMVPMRIQWIPVDADNASVLFSRLDSTKGVLACVQCVSNHVTVLSCSAPLYSLARIPQPPSDGSREHNITFALIHSLQSLADQGHVPLDFEVQWDVGKDIVSLFFQRIPPGLGTHTTITVSKGNVRVMPGR
jgi:hypothetical protein